MCGNDRGCIFTAGNEASGVYGQPVWIFIESQTKSAGRHQGIIRKKKIRDLKLKQKMTTGRLEWNDIQREIDILNNELKQLETDKPQYGK